MKEWYNRIKEANQRIRPYILKTPLFFSNYLSNMSGGKVYLKLESEQYTGSFKARGALNKILSLTTSEKERVLVTASTGNHAQGFARALSITGDKGIIYLPENADQSKIEALKHYNVDLKFHGNDSLTTEIFAQAQAKKNGYVWVSPYNDAEIIAGQGTIGLEITQELNEIDSLFGCIGGGGMMSGIASWFETEMPQTNIVGCLPENAPEMYLSVQKGEVVVLEEQKYTLSDGSAGGVEKGSITFDICKRLIHDYELANESEIANSIKFMVDKHHKIIEGAAGVAIAGFIKRAPTLNGKTIVIVICGANINTLKLKELL